MEQDVTKIALILTLFFIILFNIEVLFQDFVGKTAINISISVLIIFWKYIIIDFIAIVVIGLLLDKRKKGLK